MPALWAANVCKRHFSGAGGLFKDRKLSELLNLFQAPSLLFFEAIWWTRTSVVYCCILFLTRHAGERDAWTSMLRFAARSRMSWKSLVVHCTAKSSRLLWWRKINLMKAMHYVTLTYIYIYQVFVLLGCDSFEFDGVLNCVKMWSNFAYSGYLRV